MISRFTAYRRNLSELGVHNEKQANPDDAPQFEGVVFSDGSCVLKWLTASKSVSVFSSLSDMLQIHGHPEYGTDIQWHDGPMPDEWKRQLVAHGEHRQSELYAAGFERCKVVVHNDDAGNIVSIRVQSPSGAVDKQVYPPETCHE
jgi:hypothetical protein